MKRTISRSMSATAVALLAVATACSDAHDPLSPKLQAWNQPPPPQTAELKGTGTIPDPEGGLITFNFDVTHDATGTHGSFFAAAAPGGLPETLTASSFTSFTVGSSFFNPPGHRSQFQGGRHPGGSHHPVPRHPVHRQSWGHRPAHDHVHHQP